MTPGPIVVVTGQPGVGKSTICAALATRRPLAAHVKADDLHRMIVSGGEWPSAGTPSANRQLLTRTRNAAQVAHNLAAAGADVFVDEVVAVREQIDIFDSYIGSARWVVLTASPAAIGERDASRAKHTAAAYLDIDAAIERLVAERGTVIDTDGLDTDGTIDLVEAALAKPSFKKPHGVGPVWWLVEVTVTPENLDRFEALTREMVEAAGKEGGTLTYERYRIDDATFHFFERYESATAALQHLEGFQRRFQTRLSGMITRRRFHVYGPVSPSLRAALAPFGAAATERWPNWAPARSRKP